MKKVLLSVLALSFMSVNAYAECRASGCYGVKIDRLYVSSGGTVYVATNGDEAQLNCTSPGDVYMTVGATASGKKELYSMLLTAQTTGKTINLRATESSASCDILFATIDS